jgi:hypothetical protein
LLNVLVQIVNKTGLPKKNSMSDAILTDCSSAAICRTATKLTNYFTAIPPASTSNIMSQLNQMGDITYRATFYNILVELAIYVPQAYLMNMNPTKQRPTYMVKR